MVAPAQVTVTVAPNQCFNHAGVNDAMEKTYTAGQTITTTVYRANELLANGLILSFTQPAAPGDDDLQKTPVQAITNTRSFSRPTLAANRAPLPAPLASS